MKMLQQNITFLQKEKLSKNEITKSLLKIVSVFLDTTSKVSSTDQISAGDKDIRPYGPKIWNLLSLQIKSWNNQETARYRTGRYQKRDTFSCNCRFPITYHRASYFKICTTCFL